MAVVMSNMSGHIYNQLTRSLERILEEAQLSGELKLSGRKLKEFPNSGSKYNLTDTVIADLSKNRLSELPTELTAFPFLERLHLYHNTIRNIPDTVSTLHSLTHLDLTRNQLTVLPKEICQLPLQVLLVSSNHLTSLPDELGRMTELTELDASCNQITHLPHHLQEMTQLRSLILRSNLLLCLSIEITYLQLIRLDIRENRIQTLPIELRLMSSLVHLELDDNPLTSPPASLCKRGRVHIFKYLEQEAMQRNKLKCGINGGGTEVRRSSSRRSNSSVSSSSSAGLQSRTAPFLQEGFRHKRHNVDSGYSTSDGFDKRWSQEMQGGSEEMVRKSWQKHESSPLSISTNDTQTTSSNHSGTSTPSTISPGDQGSLEDDLDKVGNARSNAAEQIRVNKDRKIFNTKENFNGSNHGSTDVLVNGNGVDEKNRTLNHIQTYREYKEALRQQRNQDGPSVYRSRDQITPPNDSGRTKTEPNTPTHQITHSNMASSKSDPTPLHSALSSYPKQIFDDTSQSKRPIQKVPPSRNNNHFSPSHQSTPTVNGNGIDYNSLNGTPKHADVYIKPTSPIKNSCGSLSHDHVPGAGKQKNGSPKLVTTSVGYVNGPANGTFKSPVKTCRSISWNKDIPPDKLSFTMRREFDKAREESDLIEQLRNIIETRLKMALPEDIAPALTDGVVLCHLANHVKPRSVASIHVPSPAVPKLTMARCRRNVDNFLEACRKIGVEEGELCTRDDIMEFTDDRRRVQLLLRTVRSMVRPRTLAASRPEPTATDITVSALLLLAFIATVALLIMFPLPD